MSTYYGGRYYRLGDGRVVRSEDLADSELDLLGSPVVVLEPSFGAEVLRLVSALGDAGVDRGLSPSRVQAALRSLLEPPKPPKPDEPLGLGAVVIDATGVEHVHLGSGLWAYGTTDGPSAGAVWSAVDAVAVLSPGVPDPEPLADWERDLLGPDDEEG